MQLQRVLEEHNYNTVGNFLTFYEAFMRSDFDDLMTFYKHYQPPITPNHHTCVGLAIELWKRLSTQPKTTHLARHLFVVSCEENIEFVKEYTSLDDISNDTTLEKEHVLLCMKFSIAGRPGVLLCDPGYHVARVLTLMQDKLYPNTGLFTQSEENNIKKEYEYQLNPHNENFVEWHEKTTRNNAQENFTGLIYVGRKYLTSIDVTERRNLAYGFKSLLSRDQKGHLIAGIYYKLNSNEFTVFYQAMGKQRIKMKFSDFSGQIIKDDLIEKLEICNEQLKLPENALLEIVRRSGEVLQDTSFLEQLFAIENCINLISADN